MNDYINKELHFIQSVGRFGIVDYKFVEVFFNITYQTALNKVNKLVKNNTLKKITPYNYTNKKYLQLSDEYLKEYGYKKPQFNLFSIDHDIQVSKTLVRLSQQNSCYFLTERELRSDLYFKKNSHNKIHYPDGALQKDDKLIAIEIELTRKSSTRLQSIFSWYNNQNTYYKAFTSGTCALMQNHFFKLSIPLYLNTINQYVKIEIPIIPTKKSKLLNILIPPYI